MVEIHNKKALRKDLWREISKSRARFISIFCIVALGVAFFSGIQAASPDMLLSGDTYYDESKLMDLKIVSTMGLTKDDVNAVSEIDGVEVAEGAYSTDVICGSDSAQTVLHVESLNEEVNQLTVTEGCLPQKSGECFIDSTFASSNDYKVGDTITFSQENDTKLLNREDYTIVGIGKSPLYISFNRGNTTIGSGEVSGFAYVMSDDFDQDVFTQIYIRVQGSSDVISYTDAYDNLIEKVQKKVEGIEKERCQARYDDIVSEAEEELSDARKELEDARNDADEELSEAAQKLEDGEKELADGEKQYEEGKTKLENAKTKLESGKTQLESAKAQLSDGRSQIASAKQQVEDGKTQIETAKEQLEQKQEELTSAINEVKEGQTTLETQISTLNSQISELESSISQLDSAAASLSSAEDALNSAKNAVSEKQNAFNAVSEALEAAKLKVESGELSNEELSEYENSLNAAQSELDSANAAQSQAQETLNACQQAVTQKSELENNLSTAKAGLETANAKKAELDSTLSSLNENQKTIDTSKEELNKKESELAASEQEIAANEEKLNSGAAQIEANEKTITDGEKEIEENEQKLIDSKQKLEDAKKELEDGKKEYSDGEKEANEKLEEGQQKIDDAQKEIDDIDMPEWTVSDRNSLPEYSDYGDNADRLKNIGKVFPVIFFLVAALISLTTMTRMVEEQRTQIGTMKALGYSKISIASKYLSYAFIATAGGSIIGVLSGEKLLPYIIIKAYGMMYHNVENTLQINYEFKYALIASLAALVCTVGATVFACASALRETPASLMRPPAPKEGKRILLERIPFFWKHLNFTWKSSLRNLFRYKKRMCMTIFGIAGSMALMLVGYGIRDSISDIVNLQYTQLQHYEAMIISNDDASDSEKQELNDYLETSDYFDHYTNIQLSKLTAPNGKSELSVYVYVPENLENFDKDVTLKNRVTDEKYGLPTNGAAVSEKTANLLGLSIGDDLVLKKDDVEYKVKISVITENYAGHYVYMSPEVYDDTFGEEPVYQDIVFVTKDEYKDQLENIGQEIMEMPAVLSISYTSSTISMVDRMLSTFGIVIVVLIVSAGMLAFVVLYNLNNINIKERQRELATLKVLGFFDGEVSGYVLRENILLTIAGIIFGAGFGIVLHRYIIETVEVDAVMFGRNIRPISFVYCAVITCIFSIVVNVFMHKKLKKIDMVESLKSVE